MRRFFTISVVLPAVTGLLVVGLMADVVSDARRAWSIRQEAHNVSLTVAVVKDLAVAATNFRLERGAVNFALDAPDIAGPDTLNAIAGLRAESKTSLDVALSKVATISVLAIEPELDKLSEEFEVFAASRSQVDFALQQPLEERAHGLRANWTASNDDVTGAIDALADKLTNGRNIADPVIQDMLRIAHHAWSLRTLVGNERFGFTGIARSGRSLTTDEQQRFAELAGQIKENWRLIEEEIRAQAVAPEFGDAVETVNSIYFRELPVRRNAVIADLADGRPAANSFTEWRNRAIPAQAAMVTVMNIALDIADAKAVAQSIAAGKNFYAEVLLIVVIGGLGAFTIGYVLKGIVEPIKKLTNSIGLVADGNLACDIPYEHRVDEIGLLALGLRVFRDDEIERRRLRVEKEGLEAASRAKSRFIANMSHELRTPLNAIIGFSEMIKTAMLGPISERYRDYGTDIFNSGRHLLGLINEILDLAKLEAGRLQLREECVDLRTVVEACMTLVEVQARRSRIQLSSAIDSSAPILLADDQRLRQILINLLSNAVKFTPEGGKVLVSSTRKDHALAITVADTGIGMAKDDVPLALMAFGQIESGLSRKVEGTGLGLPLVKHLVELHGGKLTIESQVNVGTIVTIELPLERVVDPMAPVLTHNDSVDFALRSSPPTG